MDPNAIVDKLMHDDWTVRLEGMQEARSAIVEDPAILTDFQRIAEARGDEELTRRVDMLTDQVRKLGVLPIRITELKARHDHLTAFTTAMGPAYDKAIDQLLDIALSGWGIIPGLSAIRVWLWKVAWLDLVDRYEDALDELLGLKEEIAEAEKELEGIQEIWKQ